MIIIRLNKSDKKTKNKIKICKIIGPKEKTPHIFKKKNYNMKEIQMISYYYFKKKQLSF